MRKFIAFTSKLSTWMGGIGGVILVAMMLVTVFDVALRCIGKPMSGTYDLVALGGALVIGFSVPYATVKKGHIFVDVLTDRMSLRGKKVCALCTRVIVFCLCLMIGWHLVNLGIDFYHKHEGSQTLELSFYPIAYGLAVGFFVQCLASVAEIFNLILGGSHE
jgi:TRAP-type C4-dicarboxylate transport system permease small subunit